MQPPPDGSYAGSQGPYDPQGQQSGGEPPRGYGYPQGQTPGHQPPGGSYPGAYSYPQQGYQPGGYPTGPAFAGPGGYGYSPQPPRGVASRGWFWITLAAVVVVAAAVISTLLVTRGSSGGTPVGQGSNGPSTDSPINSPTNSGSPTDPSTSRTASSTSVSAGGDLGRTFDVQGNESGERLSLTLVAIDQNARSTDDYEKPMAGMHYVATHLRIRNIGSAKYQDAINNCVSVYDAQNIKYPITYVEDISSGTVFDDVNLAPGQSAEGWSVYEVPVGKTISSFTFTPDSGISGNVVRWKLS